jgi:hypothetical protein
LATGLCLRFPVIRELAGKISIFEAEPGFSKSPNPQYSCILRLKFPKKITGNLNLDNREVLH